MLVPMVVDLETTTATLNGRKASPFSPDNWVVAAGYKRLGETGTTYYYTREDYQYENVKPDGDESPYQIKIPEEVSMLVGANLKFDLLYSWHHPELVAFLNRGGVIWDIQYAEYLLEGQIQSSHMASLDDMADKYEGTQKIDEVKIAWKAGVNTPDIAKDLLIEYLHDDLNNTEIVFRAQVARARELGIMHGIQSRMDGLLATTECEYNGVHINTEIGMDDLALLQDELDVVNRVLKESLPELPDKLEFNWGSSVHKSCLLFGGTIRYDEWKQHRDNDGSLLYLNKKVLGVILEGGDVLPLPTYSLEGDRSHTGQLGALLTELGVKNYITYKGGKNIGNVKTKYVTITDKDRPKGAIQSSYYHLSGYATAKDEWTTKLTDGHGNPVYQTGSEIIQYLASQSDDPFLIAISNRSKITKDMDTFYLGTDKQGNKTGLLSMEQNGIIHHSLHHTSTVTSRLSSSKPNLQQIPRNDFDADLGREKSRVKRMFTSRYPDGYMVEIDYSQLEVVVQGLITNDANLLADINKGIDFHCKRLSVMLDEDYHVVYNKCHDEAHPGHKRYKKLRTKAKGFTFARAFGAGRVSIAANTGLTEEEVQVLMDAEEMLYPGVSKFYDAIEIELSASRVPTQHLEPMPDKAGQYVQCGLGYHTGITQTRFGFYEIPLPAYKRKLTGRQTGWYRPTVQNFPVQGTAGHIVQIAIGKLFRFLKEKDPYCEHVAFVNTIHDCAILDCKSEEFALHVGKLAQCIMEDVPKYLKEIFNLDCPVPFPCSAEYGKNLFTMKGIQ